MLNPLIFDQNIFTDSAPKELVRRLTNLHNRVMDMAICDLLQDGEFAKRSEYDREEFCDSHGLLAYRLFGSSDLGHTVERSPDNDDQRGYSYRLNKTSRDYLIMFPNGDRAKSP